MARGSFDDVIREETRMSSRGDDAGQSSRDRAARRMNVRSGKNPNPRTSTAYKEDKPKQSVKKSKGKAPAKKRSPVDESIDDTLDVPVLTPRPDTAAPADDSSGIPWWMALIPGYRRPGPTAPIDPNAPPGGGGGGGGPMSPVPSVPPGGDALPAPLVVPPPIDPRRMQPNAMVPVDPSGQSVQLGRVPNEYGGLALPAPSGNTPEDAIIQRLLEQSGGAGGGLPQLALPPPNQVPIDVPTEDIERPRVRRPAPTRPMRVPVG